MTYRNNIEKFTVIHPTVYVKRIAHSNERVTKHKRYLLLIEKQMPEDCDHRLLKIVDDKGMPMEPILNIDGYSNYWCIEELNAEEKAMLHEMTKRKTGNNLRYKDLKNPTPASNEVKKMKISITNPILINGDDVDDLTDDQLLDYIREIQSAIDELSELNVESKRIAKLINEHVANLKILVTLFDKRN